MTLPTLGVPLLPAVSLFALAGAGAGLLMAWWAERLMRPAFPDLSKSLMHKTRWIASLGTGLLFAILVWGIVGGGVQEIPEVQPFEFGRFCQILFQLSLISLLVAVTITDIWEYIIPDQIVLVGIAIGLGGHLLSGDLQIQHIWVDWNAEVPGLQGQEFPVWITTHRHLHGLAVGLAGLLTGAGITWLVRFVSSAILGQETMGMGDVTLMAMIGSFLGWQPTLFVFALAPLTGLAISLIQRVLGGKTYLAYGPFLALACFLVLMFWKRLWTPLRYLFGHPPSIAVLIGAAAAAFVVLLILLRLYRTIPISESNRYSASPVSETGQSESVQDRESA